VVAVTIYHVEASRAGRWWALQCVEHPAAFSQVTRLEKAEAMAREAIAFVADEDPSTFEVEVVPMLPTEYATQLASAAEARQLAQEANSAAAAHSREAARALARAGLSVRDIGTVMGVSHQRAAQLLAS
jgi:hypothetical protein